MHILLASQPESQVFQTISQEWHGNALANPYEFSISVDAEHLIYRARRQQAAQSHPEAQPGCFQENLWMHDAAEMFIAKEDLSRYLEVNLSPNGAWWTCCFSAPRVNEASILPAQGILTESKVLEDSWEACIRIPLTYLKALGLEPKKCRIAVCAILNSPEQIFLTTAENIQGTPDFHQLKNWPLVREIINSNTN